MMRRLLLAFPSSVLGLVAFAQPSPAPLSAAKGFAVEEVYRVARDTQGS